MANRVYLRNPVTNATKSGLLGFSWTTLFFGFFVPLVRGMFGWFLIMLLLSIIIGVITHGGGLLFINLLAAFFINKSYTRRLVMRGYTQSNGPSPAAMQLGINA